MKAYCLSIKNKDLPPVYYLAENPGKAKSMFIKQTKKLGLEIPFIKLKCQRIKYFDILNMIKGPREIDPREMNIWSFLTNHREYFISF